MRNGQNNKRMRNRNNNNNSNRNDDGRRGQNPMTRVFESNGPDIKIRGTASHVAEKYVQLARDARSSGDPVAAENYYQHAEHYFRLIAAAQEQFRQNQPQPRTDNEMASEDGDDEGESFSHFGQEPGFVPVQQQPFVPRDNNPRDSQPPDQPREPASAARARASSAAAVSTAAAATAAGDSPIPAASTGCHPSSPDRSRRSAGGPAGFEGGERDRFPRRRRRPHGPRPDGMAAPAAAPSDDFNPGNE